MNSGIGQRRTRMPDLSITEALPGSVALRPAAVAIQFAGLTPMLKSKDFSALPPAKLRFIEPMASERSSDPLLTIWRGRCTASK